MTVCAVWLVLGKCLCCNDLIPFISSLIFQVFSCSWSKKSESSTVKYFGKDHGHITFITFSRLRVVQMYLVTVVNLLCLIYQLCHRYLCTGSHIHKNRYSVASGFHVLSLCLSMQRVGNTKTKNYFIIVITLVS